jgi:hypothetical protein
VTKGSNSLLGRWKRSVGIVKPDGGGAKVCKLVHKLRFEHGVGVSLQYSFRRTRAGYWQRSAGAWSWSIRYMDEGHIMEIGSQWPVTELLRRGFVVDRESNDIHLYPRRSNNGT